MPHPPVPPDFRAAADKMSTAQLERSLGWIEEKAQSGDRIAQDMLIWTQDLLKERAKTENQLVLGVDGHTYTAGQYREKRERDNAQAELGALTGNFASALVFKLTGDPHLAGIAGGLFSAAGGTAKGLNENRQVKPIDAAPGRPSGSAPPRDVEPPSGSAPSQDGEPSSAPAQSASSDGAAWTSGSGTGGFEILTWADLIAFAEKVFGIPDSVIEATRELTRAGVPPTEATADFLALFTAAATEAGSEPLSVDPLDYPAAEDGPEVEPGTGPLSSEALEQQESAAEQGPGGEESHAAEPDGQSYAPDSDELGSASEPYAPDYDELDVASSDGEQECSQQDEDGQYGPAPDELDAVTGEAGGQGEQVQSEQVQSEQVQSEQVQYEQVQYEQVQYEG